MRGLAFADATGWLALSAQAQAAAPQAEANTQQSVPTHYVEAAGVKLTSARLWRR